MGKKKKLFFGFFSPSQSVYDQVVHVFKQEFRKMYIHTGSTKNPVKVYGRWTDSLLQNVPSISAFHTCARESRKDCINGPKDRIAVL